MGFDLQFFLFPVDGVSSSMFLPGAVVPVHLRMSHLTLYIPEIQLVRVGSGLNHQLTCCCSPNSGASSLSGKFISEA